MSGSTQCPHSDVSFHLNHVHLADATIHYVRSLSDGSASDRVTEAPYPSTGRRDTNA